MNHTNKLEDNNVNTTYKPPVAEEIRDYLKTNGLTGAQAADMVGVDPRTFRRYMAHTNPKSVPYAVWFTLRTKARVAMMGTGK